MKLIQFSFKNVIYRLVLYLEFLELNYFYSCYSIADSRTHYLFKKNLSTLNRARIDSIFRSNLELVSCFYDLK